MARLCTPPLGALRVHSSQLHHSTGSCSTDEDSTAVCSLTYLPVCPLRCRLTRPCAKKSPCCLHHIMRPYNQESTSGASSFVIPPPRAPVIRHYRQTHRTRSWLLWLSYIAIITLPGTQATSPFAHLPGLAKQAAYPGISPRRISRPSSFVTGCCAFFTLHGKANT